MSDPIKFKIKRFHNSTEAVLIRGGKVYFDLLQELIDEARIEIHLQVYILENDSTGRSILNALMNAAKRGVSVYLVLDAYGSNNISNSVVDEIIKSGIHFKWFKPIIQFGNMELGRRMHHKILCVDEQICVVSGANIADRYNDTEDSPAWLDFAILAKGVVAIEVKRRCLQIWEKNFALLNRRIRIRIPAISSAIEADNLLLKTCVNDWLRGRVEIFNGYLNSFKAAESEIIIVGGYFMPGRITRKRLAGAAKRGVKISIILTATSDVMFAKPASEYLYHWMFKYGVNIYEWQPEILHGKVAVVDGKWSTIGSFNLNYLSTFESLELNLEVIDDDFSSRFRQMLVDISQNECRQILKDEYYKRLSFSKLLFNWFSYRFVRWSMRLLNAFSNKPKPN